MQSVRELRAEQTTIASRMAVLSRKNMTEQERAEFEILADAAERRKSQIARIEGRTVDVQEREARAFTKYLRAGEQVLTDEERYLLHRPLAQYRDMGTGGGNALQGTGAGYFVPVGFADRVETSLKFHSDVWKTSTILDTTTGQPFPFPTADDSSVSGSIVYEDVQTPMQDIAAISTVIFRAFKFSSALVRVTRELVEDAFSDLEGYLSDQFAIRLARASTPLFTTGLGFTNVPPQPRGIMLDAVDSGVVVVGDDVATSPDPTKQIGYLDLVGLEMSLDAAYRQRASWLMNSKTLAYLKTLRDKNSRPLYPSLADREPDDPSAPSGTLNGYPVRLNESLDDLAAAKKPILFGDLSKYSIRRVQGMRLMRLNERFADRGEIAFLMWARWDGALLDAGTHPVKYLTMHS